MGDLGSAYLRHREQAILREEPISDLYRRLRDEQDAHLAAQAEKQRTENPKGGVNA
jgi:hypothetical protein